MPEVSSHRKLTPIHSKTTVGDTTNMEDQAEETVEEMVDRQEAGIQVVTEAPQDYVMQLTDREGFCIYPKNLKKNIKKTLKQP